MKRAIAMQRVRLHQHPVRLHDLQQRPQRLDFAADVGGVGGLGDRDTQRMAVGVMAYLGDTDAVCRRQKRTAPVSFYAD
jgi:hypothetical protein